MDVSEEVGTGKCYHNINRSTGLTVAGTSP